MTNAKRTKNKHETRHGSSKLNDFSFNKAQLPQIHDEALKTYQQRAWEAFQRLNFPTTKDEAWRRTNIRKLQTEKFKKHSSHINGQSPEKMSGLNVSEGDVAGEIILGSDEKSPILDPKLKAKGVIFDDLQTVREQRPELLSRLLGKIIAGDEDKFTALAAAMADDGVLLYVPKNIIIEHPFTSLFWGEGEHTAFITHLIIWVEEGSQITMIHESASSDQTGEAQVFHDGIVEIHVGRNARVNFVELQS